MSETVEEFFRIHIENDANGERLARELTRLTPPLPGAARVGRASRPVVFMALYGTASNVAFASEGACTMLAAIGVPLMRDVVPITWRELPHGLVLVVGDASDRDRYERRTQ